MLATVTLTAGRVTDHSTVTVDGVTVPLLDRTEAAGRLAPARIAATLAGLGFRTVRILPAGATTVDVLVAPSL